MRDPFDSDRRRRENRLLDLDARLDSAMFRFRAGLSSSYAALTAFMGRFRVRGFRRAIAELSGETLTLGTGGALLALTLALPSFEATRIDWRNQSEYSITFLDRFGNEIGKRGVRHSDSVPLAEMPDHLIKAVLATEDRRFFEHFGIDVLGTARAMVENLRANAVVQGGSSLSQQLAKNLFLSNERTIERKIKEAFLAVWLEINLSKREILELYLDRAYMGGGNFGVEAASEFYFRKSVKDVTLAEAAMLAGLFKAPARYAPHVNLPAARARANEVLSNLVQAGMMTEGQVIGARRHPAEAVQQAVSTTPDYFLDWAFDRVKEKITTGDRTLTVKTTLDPNLQKVADNAIEAALRENGERYKVGQGALVALEPDGALRAMVGGRDYGDSQFNRAVDALRQPGSSFKPFVYATAMANGYTPRSIVSDEPITIGDWSPQNYGRSFAGPVPLTTALVKSINTIPVRLGMLIGRNKIVDTARRMGITTDLPLTASLPLGVTEVSVIDMASAYAVFANGGLRAMPYAFTKITNTRGETVYDRGGEPAPARVLDEKVTAAMNSILVQVPEWGTGTRARLDMTRTAGKTGTTNSYRDAWFVGYTGNYVAAVWFGNDNFTPTRNMTGGTLPAETWKQFMSYAHTGIELRPIPFVDDPGFRPQAPQAPAAVADAGRPVSLSHRSAEQLQAIGRMLRAAPRLALPQPPAAAALTTPSGGDRVEIAGGKEAPRPTAPSLR